MCKVQAWVCALVCYTEKRSFSWWILGRVLAGVAWGYTYVPEFISSIPSSKNSMRKLQLELNLATHRNGKSITLLPWMRRRGKTVLENTKMEKTTTDPKRQTSIVIRESPIHAPPPHALLSQLDFAPVWPLGGEAVKRPTMQADFIGLHENRAFHSIQHSLNPPNSRSCKNLTHRYTWTPL